MKTNGNRNLALLLPLFYKFAREVREGVIDWMNLNPEWRVIELHLEEVKARKAFARHIAGAVFWPRSPECRSWRVVKTWDQPTVVCGASRPAHLRMRRLVNVSFDRGSVSRLAVEHFKHLGFEVAGYVGSRLMSGGKLEFRAAGMRELALAQGMEWVWHDIGGKDPEMSPELLWEGAESRPLRDFLRKCPKPVALLAEDDYIGAMVCETALSLDIEVPGEVAVLGQGDRLVGLTGNCPLSSVVLPGRRVGYLAAEFVRTMAEQPGTTPANQMIPCEHIAIRESTGGLSCDLNVEKAKRFLDRHLLEGVTLDQLTAVSGYAPKTLRQKFKEHYGIEVSRFARERRCEEIVRLIRGSGGSLGEIGRRCGFDSPSAFCNFVVRNTGMSPAEHRGGTKR